MSQIPKIEVVDIDREKAIDMMQRNIDNRPKFSWLSDRYADAMTNGKFPMNGETIKISVSGRILDGQHRLEGVIKSGVTIRFIVVSGLPDEVFSTIDTGKKRSAGDTLAVKKVRNYNAVAGAIRWLYTYRKTIDAKAAWMNNITEYSNDTVVEIIEKEPHIEDIVSTIRDEVPAGFFSGAVICGICCEISRKNTVEEMREFILPVLKGTGLIEGTPQHTLRSKLLNNAMSRSKFPPHVISAMIVLAWNAYKMKRPMKLLRWNFGEKFPEII